MRTVRSPACDFFVRIHLAAFASRWSAVSWYSSKALPNAVVGPSGKRRALLGDELLLSDHLGSGSAMGDGKASSSRTSVRPKALPKKFSGSADLVSTDGETAFVRERTAVEAGLHPGKVVVPPHIQSKDKRPVPSHLARRVSDGFIETVNAMSAAYAPEPQPDPDDWTESVLQGQPTEMQDVGDLEAGDAKAKELVRLRVQPWHRHELCKMVCRHIRFSCVQELRSLQRQKSHQLPMWEFERQRVESYVASARIVSLVDYLARLHFQIQRGQQRQKYIPGVELDISISRLKEITLEERRSMSAAFQAEMGRKVSENTFVRHFLDGDMSWATVCKLLQRRKPFHS
ncbi:SHOC2 [Symbiodinium natans]|uniref:SHOC2 protein n=1 Tax=Symbiodinium natans TaxID=878477 RepID=A0A812U9N1_9DINO|nr:SHOC2 [Symbiodinium natans]